MKVWFDVLTPKQVMFFGRAVALLRQSGHQVLCTSREYREVVDLARIKGLDLTIAGRHGGAGRYEKLRASAQRTYGLADIVNRFAPDAAVTFASPEGARVAYGLGTKHIGFNDSPHAEAVARLTVPLTGRLLCPWVIPYSAWAGYGIARKNVTRYWALDPAAWLKHEKARAKTGAGRGRTVLIRLGESKASYIADRKLGASTLVDAAVDGLSQIADVAILCRYPDQMEEAKARYGSRARVIEEVVDGVPLIMAADLFIGAGGTMSAEAALLGVPTISIFPGSFYVTDYLARTGLVANAGDPKSVVRLGKKMLQDDKFRMAYRRRAARLLAWMEDPTDRMMAAIKSA